MKVVLVAAFVPLISSSAYSFEAVPNSEVIWMTGGLDAASQHEKDEFSDFRSDVIFMYPGSLGEPWVMFEWSWNLGGRLEDTVSKRVKQTQTDLDQLYQFLDVARSSTHEASDEVIAEIRARVTGLDLDGDRRFDLCVKIRNGNEVIEVPDASIRDGVVTWGFPHYDSRIVIDRSEDGVLRGVWHKVRNDTVHQMQFLSFQDQRASLSSGHIVQPVSRVFGQVDTAECDVRSSRWKVEFEKSGEAIGELEAFVPQPKPRDTDMPFQLFTDYSWILRGTFRTPTGEFRYLAGEMRGPQNSFCWVGSYQPVRYQLSTFDGADAVLFRAKSIEGGSLKGDCWSGNWHHETWTAERIEP